MKSLVKPVIVPTLMSSKITLWCLILTGFFVSLFLVYNRYDACRVAQEELSRPVSTEIETQYFKTTMPPGWREWSTDGKSAVMYRKSTGTVPFIEIFAKQNPSYAYRALDANSAMMAQHIHEGIVRHGVVSSNSTDTAVDVMGSEIFPVRPGVSAVRLLFDLDEKEGEAVAFFLGDVYYIVIGVHDDVDTQADEDIARFIRHIGDCAEFPDWRDSIEREIIDTSGISSELIEEVQEKTAREIALWQLFSTRAEHEPDAALLPAITHFREAIKALSRIRCEYQLLQSEDFAKYCAFLETRKANVNEWFVQFDKLLAMRDFEGARKQARFIISHATLIDESLERRRASEKLAELMAEAEAAEKEGN